MLSNRYYLGYVTFRGVEYQGKPQPLISQQTYDQVQEIMRSRRVSGEKRRKHITTSRAASFAVSVVRASA